MEKFHFLLFFPSFSMSANMIANRSLQLQYICAKSASHTDPFRFTHLCLFPVMLLKLSTSSAQFHFVTIGRAQTSVSLGRHLAWMLSSIDPMAIKFFILISCKYGNTSPRLTTERDILQHLLNANGTKTCF